MSFSAMRDGQIFLRDQSLVDMIGSRDFVSTLWLVWTGSWPNEPVRSIIQACLVACLDHGEDPPSAQVTRIVASCGKPLAESVAAGVLTFGARHGNAGSAASRWLRETVSAGRSVEQAVNETIAHKRRVPGFGHLEYDTDPRTAALVECARAQSVSLRHTHFALDFSAVLSARKGKPLPLNIDGALGALMADLDAPPEVADALFLVSRCVGLAMHAREEAETATAYRRGSSH